MHCRPLLSLFPASACPRPLTLHDTVKLLTFAMGRIAVNHTRTEGARSGPRHGSTAARIARASSVLESISFRSRPFREGLLGALPSRTVRSRAEILRRAAADRLLRTEAFVDNSQCGWVRSRGDAVMPVRESDSRGQIRHGRLKLLRTSEMKYVRTQMRRMLGAC